MQKSLLAGSMLAITTLFISAAPFDGPTAASSRPPATIPTQPVQPTRGPGSSDYPHSSLDMLRYGEGAEQYWLFLPAEPPPARAPVVVFLHGWGAMQPAVYGAWIKHLVRRGSIVIFPRFQKDLRTLPREMAGHAAAAVRAAIAQLDARQGPGADLERVAYVGHSMGAILAANLAQRSSELSLPRPRALFIAEPTFEPLVSRYDQIAADTLLLVAVGAEVRRDASARRIFIGSSRIPAENKNYVELPSDDHGSPPLVSDHFSPCAADSLGARDDDADRERWRSRTRDALDYFGYWKLCDGLLDAAFFDTNREYGLGNTAEVRFLGHWSDGVAVRAAQVRAAAELSD